MDSLPNDDGYRYTTERQRRQANLNQKRAADDGGANLNQKNGDIDVQPNLNQKNVDEPNLNQKHLCQPNLNQKERGAGYQRVMSTDGTEIQKTSNAQNFLENISLDITEDIEDDGETLSGEKVPTVDNPSNNGTLSTTEQPPSAKLPDRLHYNEWPRRRWHWRFLRALSEGNSVTGAAKEARVAVGTVYKAKSRSEEFSIAWDFHYRTIGGDKFEDFVLTNAAKGNSSAIKLGLQLRGRLGDDSGKGDINIQINQAYEDVVVARFAAQARRRLEEKEI
jgi:hypothetical protein